MKLQLSKHDFATFLSTNADQNLRTGQAFYNDFRLHKVTNQEQFGNLYELDGLDAYRKILDIFEFV